jgi:hypothetical protein
MSTPPNETPGDRIAREDNEYRAKKERVRRGELCYYCMERPPTKMALHVADGSRLPACDACFDRQVEFGKAKAKTSTGCMLVGAAILAAVVFAISRCW